MNKLRVVLSPTTKKMTGYTPVGAVTIRLKTNSKGASAVTATPQAATFQLLDLPADAKQTPTVIFSINGTIKTNTVGKKEVPFFDSGVNSPTVALRLRDSDFVIGMTVDSSNFSLPTVNDFLVLPWAATLASPQKKRVGAKLTIAGATEADIPSNDTLDLPMNYLAVPDDGTNASDTSSCVGIGTVYSTKLFNLKATDRVAFAGKTMAVFLEDTIGQSLNRLTPGSYTVALLNSALTTIMSDAGFAALTVTEFTRTDPSATALWTGGGTVLAKGVPSSMQVIAGQGAKLSFFTFWAFADFSRVQGGEAALSEGLNPTKPVDIKAGTKLVVKPIAVFLHNTAPLPNAVSSLTDPSDIPKILACTLAHEIGHSLGFRHAVSFNASGGTYSKTTRVGVMSAGTLVDGGGLVPQLYGPVHKAVIKKTFL